MFLFWKWFWSIVIVCVSFSTAYAATGLNDPYISKQTYLTQHNILAAQQMINGNGKLVKVAVIDTMIDIKNIDLAKNILTNRNEIPWNNKDDDKNYYIDDVHWRDFTTNTATGIAWDHGTFVASIIWAVSNNGIGIAWIAKNIRILPLWVSLSGDKYSGNDWYVKMAITYAIEANVDIINISMWSIMKRNDISKEMSRAQKKGIIVVVSAWNDGIDTALFPVVPLNLEKDPWDIIWVGAIDSLGKVEPRSNYWSHVDVYALWESIYSAKTNNTYWYWDGTSFSAPIISGIIALWYNKYGKLPAKTIYDALQKSKNKNGFIDAALYLTVLQTMLPKTSTSK